MTDEKKKQIVDALLARGRGDPSYDVTGLPVVMFDMQLAAGNKTSSEAEKSPGRMAFAMAAASLGFIGDELPPLFYDHVQSYWMGAEIRLAYDEALYGAKVQP